MFRTLLLSTIRVAKHTGTSDCCLCFIRTVHSSAKITTRANDRFKKSISNRKGVISESASSKTPESSDHGGGLAGRDLRLEETRGDEQDKSDNAGSRRRKTLAEVEDAGIEATATLEDIQSNTAGHGEGRQSESGATFETITTACELVKDTEVVEPVKPKRRGRPPKKDLAPTGEVVAPVAGKSREQGSVGIPKRRRTKKLLSDDGKDITAAKADAQDQERSSSTKKPRTKAPGKNWPAGCSPAEYLFVENKHASTGGRPLGDKARINVVSPSLCGTIFKQPMHMTITNGHTDDVIERLGSSLDKHMGCDILDINPGVGIWSSKLHDRLKPRSHILMEPDQALYQPFLQPLADAEGSRYKLLSENGLVWSTMHDVLTEDHFPYQVKYSNDDPRLTKVNNTLLVVANIGYHPRKSYLGFNSVALLVVHQLLSATRTHALFNGYGLVRMLLWMADGEKNALLPRTVMDRTKFSVEAEISCETAQEVAGASFSTGTLRQREFELDIASAKKTAERMVAAGIHTPEHRQNLSVEKDPEISGYDAERAYQSELVDLTKAFERGEFKKHEDSDRPQGSKVIQKLTPQYHRMRILRNRSTLELKRWQHIKTLLANYEAIKIGEHLPADLIGRPVIDPERIEEVRKQLVAWEESLGLEELSPEMMDRLFIRIEDRRVFNQERPLLMWDRRQAEPLHVQKDEFFPAKEMALIDFQPQTLPAIIGGSNLRNYDYFDFLVATLFKTPATSIVQAMHSAAPGSVEWVLPLCPSLVDASKGGNPNLNHLSVRSLSLEMLTEIMEVWMEWPFRPTKAEMMMKMGSYSHMAGEENEVKRSDL